uniref:Uncharacterized protein n=1 Tax=Anguilla anguilla TaxID=7936 RepID=A0A0E9WQ37_ANGAN
MHLLLIKKRAICGLGKKMYLISRQLWDGDCGIRAGIVRMTPVHQTPAFRWLAWYLKGEKAGRLEHSQHV